jgi:hypothetical protein
LVVPAGVKKRAAVFKNGTSFRPRNTLYHRLPPATHECGSLRVCFHRIMRAQQDSAGLPKEAGEA